MVPGWASAARSQRCSLYVRQQVCSRARAVRIGLPALFFHNARLQSFADIVAVNFIAISTERNMKGKAALVLIVVAAMLPGHADAQSVRRKLPSRTALRAELQLTASQIAREKAIHNQYAPLIKSARRASRDSASRLRDVEVREFRTILTPSQQEKLDAATEVAPRHRRGSVARVVPVRISVPR